MHAMAPFETGVPRGKGGSVVTRAGFVCVSLGGGGESRGYTVNRDSSNILAYSLLLKSVLYRSVRIITALRASL